VEAAVVAAPVEAAVVAAPVEAAVVAAPVEAAVVAAPVEAAVVAAPVEPMAIAPEVVEPVLVDVEGLLALPVGGLLVALDAVVVACRLPPPGNTVLAWDV
jgi:hypothetical protein